MTAIDPQVLDDSAEKEARKQRLFTRINKADGWFQVLGLSWMTPVLKAAAGDNPKSKIVKPPTIHFFTRNTTPVLDHVIVKRVKVLINFATFAIAMLGYLVKPSSH